VSTKAVTDLTFPAEWCGPHLREPATTEAWAIFIATAVRNHALQAAAEGVRHLLQATTPLGTPDYLARIQGARLAVAHDLLDYL
jgi:hypothetical protein